jgi:predicted nucleic acid-binding protein
VEALELALADHVVCLPPVVLTELLSDPKLPADVARLLQDVPVLELMNGYWERAGELRSRVITSGRKAGLADTLISQTCIDHGTALITRDRDFRNFAAVAPLKLAGL